MASWTRVSNTVVTAVIHTIDAYTVYFHIFYRQGPCLRLDGFSNLRSLITREQHTWSIRL